MGTSKPSLSKRKIKLIQPNRVSKAEVVLCQFCGKNNHSNADCCTRTSEFTNNQNRPYIGSEAHGRLVKATGDRDWIPNFKELEGLMSKTGQSSGPFSSAAKTSKPSKDWKSKGTYVSTILPIKLHIATSPNLLPVVLTFVSQEEGREALSSMPSWTLDVSPELEGS